jgi:hypothetical protein
MRAWGLVAWHLVGERGGGGGLRLILGNEEVLGLIPVGGIGTVMYRWRP